MLLGLLWLAALLLWVVWAQMSSPAGWRLAVEAVLVLAAAAGCLLGWKRVPSGDLAWDGGNWHWHAAGVPDSCHVRYMVLVADLQQIMMLQATLESGRKLWFWPERGSQADRWLDFRRAVHSPQRALEGLRMTGPMQFDEAPVAVQGERQLRRGTHLPHHP